MFGLLGLLFLTGAVVLAARWLLPVVLVAVLVHRAAQALQHGAEARRRQREERDALRARADQQRGWVWVGDPRGIYGEYPPADV